MTPEEILIRADTAMKWREKVKELDAEIAALRAEIRTLEREISELPLSTTMLCVLDDVIHVLGVEDSEVTPAERAREWLAEIEAERKIIARLQEALERVIKESENPTSLEFLYALNDARAALEEENGK